MDRKIIKSRRVRSLSGTARCDIPRNDHCFGRLIIENLFKLQYNGVVHC